MAKLMIWQNTNVDPEDYKEFLDEEYPDLDENERLELVQEMNWEYLDDERANLNKELGTKIVTIADLCRWDGMRSAYRIEKSTNLNSILHFDRDIEYAEWFVESGELQGIGIHHDGRNYYTYRALNDVIPDKAFAKIMDGTADDETLLKHTHSLAPIVADVYGWTLDEQKNEQTQAVPA